MNKKPAIGFAVMTAAVLLAAALSIVLRLLFAETAGAAAASADFARLETTLAAVREARDLAEPGLRSRLGAHYAASPQLLFASVHERGAGVRWLIPAGSPYLAAPSLSKERPQPLYPRRSALLYSAPLPGDPSGRLVLDALYLILPQSTVFGVFRDAALGLGAYLALAGLLFLIAFGGRRNQEEASWTMSGPARGAEGPLPGEEAPTAETDALPPEEEEEFPIPEILPDRMEEEFEEPKLPEAECLDGAGSPAKTEAEEPCTVPPEPHGLYSPLSNLGWESYLLDRLDAELARSASFEQDLCLVLVEYQDLSPDRPAYPLVAEAIVDFFGFRDLAFEHGSGGFAIIAPTIAVEEGIRQTEEFLKKLLFTLREKAGIDPLEMIPLFFGLSSRAGRLVEGARLLHEAEAALARAKDEQDSRIIAFRPDPDKYRAFLASKSDH